MSSDLKPIKPGRKQAPARRRAKPAPVTRRRAATPKSEPTQIHDARQQQTACATEPTPVVGDEDIAGLYQSVLPIHAAVWQDGPWRCVAKMELAPDRKYWLYGDTKEDLKRGAMQAHHHYMATMAGTANDRQQRPQQQTMRPARPWVLDFTWTENLPKDFSWVHLFFPPKTESPAIYYLVEPDHSQIEHISSVLGIPDLYS